MPRLIPIVRSEIDRINQAISEGEVHYPTFAYIPSTEQLGFIDKDQTLHILRADFTEIFDMIGEVPEGAESVYQYIGILPSDFDNVINYIDSILKTIATRDTIGVVKIDESLGITEDGNLSHLTKDIIIEETDTEQTLNYGDSFDIDELKVTGDEYGHISELNTTKKTFSLPTVDEGLSETSELPVQNKAVTNAILSLRALIEDFIGNELLTLSGEPLITKSGVEIITLQKRDIAEIIRQALEFANEYTDEEVQALKAYSDETFIPLASSKITLTDGNIISEISADTNAYLKLDKATISPNAETVENINITLPTESGTLVTTDDIPTNISELNNDSGFITNVVNDLVNYYTKSETYTQAEIDNLISVIPKFAIKVVQTLPTTDISTTTLYLVKEESGDLYSEYIYLEDEERWERLGAQELYGVSFEVSADGTQIKIIDDASGDFVTVLQKTYSLTIDAEGVKLQNNVGEEYTVITWQEIFAVIPYADTETLESEITNIFNSATPYEEG